MLNYLSKYTEVFIMRDYIDKIKTVDNEEFDIHDSRVEEIFTAEDKEKVEKLPAPGNENKFLRDDYTWQVAETVKVTPNPDLSGGEPDLKGLQVGDNKFKIQSDIVAENGQLKIGEIRGQFPIITINGIDYYHEASGVIESGQPYSFINLTPNYEESGLGIYYIGRTQILPVYKSGGLTTSLYYKNTDNQYVSISENLIIEGFVFPDEVYYSQTQGEYIGLTTYELLDTQNINKLYIKVNKEQAKVQFYYNLSGDVKASPINEVTDGQNTLNLQDKRIPVSLEEGKFLRDDFTWQEAEKLTTVYIGTSESHTLTDEEFESLKKDNTLICYGNDPDHISWAGYYYKIRDYKFDDFMLYEKINFYSTIYNYTKQQIKVTKSTKEWEFQNSYSLNKINANPILEGSESNLTSLQIGTDKYKIPEMQILELGTSESGTLTEAQYTLAASDNCIIRINTYPYESIYLKSYSAYGPSFLEYIGITLVPEGDVVCQKELIIDLDKAYHVQRNVIAMSYLHTYEISAQNYQLLIQGNSIGVDSTLKMMIENYPIIRFTVENTDISIVFNKIINSNGAVVFQYCDYNSSNDDIKVKYLIFELNYHGTLDYRLIQKDVKVLAKTAVEAASAGTIQDVLGLDSSGNLVKGSIAAGIEVVEISGDSGTMPSADKLKLKKDNCIIQDDNLKIYYKNKNFESSTDYLNYICPDIIKDTYNSFQYYINISLNYGTWTKEKLVINTLPDVPEYGEQGRFLVTNYGTTETSGHPYADWKLLTISVPIYQTGGLGNYLDSLRQDNALIRDQNTSKYYHRTFNEYYNGSLTYMTYSLIPEISEQNNSINCGIKTIRINASTGAYTTQETSTTIVKPNPTLSGTETNLESIQVGTNKYKIPQFSSNFFYNATNTYSNSQVVFYNGYLFISLQDNNTGNTPDSTQDTTYWMRFVVPSAS